MVYPMLNEIESRLQGLVKDASTQTERLHSITAELLGEVPQPSTRGEPLPGSSYSGRMGAVVGGLMELDRYLEQIRQCNNRLVEMISGETPAKTLGEGMPMARMRY